MSKYFLLLISLHCTIRYPAQVMNLWNFVPNNFWVNPLQSGVAFLYPLKTSEKLKVF